MAPAELRAALAALRPVGRGTLRGALYDLGEHPGAVPDENASGRIAGEVFELPADLAVLARLDAYEGYTPECPSQSSFVRVRRAIERAGGGAVECWVYAYARPPGGAPRVASGDWLVHLRERARSGPR